MYTDNLFRLYLHGELMPEALSTFLYFGYSDQKGIVNVNVLSSKSQQFNVFKLFLLR